MQPLLRAAHKFQQHPCAWFCFTNVSSSTGSAWRLDSRSRREIGNELRLYIKRKSRCSVSVTLPPDYSRGLFQRSVKTPALPKDNYAGLIDDLRIYNRALSANEVGQLYAVESAPHVDLIKSSNRRSPTFSRDKLSVAGSGDLNTWTNKERSLQPPTDYDLSPVLGRDNWNSLYFRLQLVP